MASPGKKSFPLRVDPELWSEVERLAAQELRSANAQAEMLLREALGRRGIRLGSPKSRLTQNSTHSSAHREREPDGKD